MLATLYILYYVDEWIDVNNQYTNLFSTTCEESFRIFSNYLNLNSLDWLNTA